MSRVSGSTLGGDDVFLLCTKVNKKDIQVRFYEPNSTWEAFGKFTEADVHYQYAIVFQTPPYHQHNITNPVTVLLQLLRRNGDASEPKEFTYIPDDSDDERISKKRKKNGLYQKFDESGGDVYRNFGTQDHNPIVHNHDSLMNPESVNDSSLGSSCTFVGYSAETLDTSLSSSTYLKSFDAVFDFLIGNNLKTLNNAVLLKSHENPLLSEVNGNASLWTYEYGVNHFDLRTNRSLLEGDMSMNSRYLGYPLSLKGMAFVPSLIGFAMFGILTYLYGRFAPKPYLVSSGGL